MTFTDDDMKRLKESLKGTYRNLPIDDLAALLSRLVAAERVADHFQHKANTECLECEVSLEAWRKAAGK